MGSSLRTSISKRQAAALTTAIMLGIAVAVASAFIVRVKLSDPETPLLRTSDFSSFDSNPRVGFHGLSSVITEDGDLYPERPKCDSLVAAEQQLASTSPKPLGTSISARGPEEVIAFILEPPTGKTASDLFEEMNKEIDSCLITSKRLNKEGIKQTMARVDDLPFAAIGYQWTNDVWQAQDRAYAVTDDGRLLVVSISTHGLVGPEPSDGNPRIQPPITLDFLLRTVIPRIDDIGAK